MMVCPQCGAASEVGDVFCEVDGARLVAARVVDGACPGCGATATDDGDGYCSTCGHRLAAGPKDPVPTKDEAAAIVIFRDDPRFPPGPGAAPRGAPLAVMAASIEPAAGVAIVRALVDIADAFEAARLAWSPEHEDLRLVGSRLVLGRLRGTRPLATEERLDVQLALDALGRVLLPEPSAWNAPFTMAPPALVRALVTAPSGHRRGRTIDEARALVAEGERTIDVPADDAPDVASLTDVGVRHLHNEDAVAVATGSPAEPWSLLVVCDGVSSSAHAEIASAIAARTARDALAHFVASGEADFDSTSSAVAEAIRAAHVAVCASTLDVDAANPPGTTIVCALVHRRRLTVGWVGDSRAYWVTKRGAELLTRDHSWVNETVDRGEMSEEEALRSPLAHALTRCLGPLEDPKGEVRPSVKTRDLAGPGHLLLCSDGVWNYFTLEELRAHVGAVADLSAAAIARSIVNRALAAGGHDNASVAVYHHR